MKPRTPPPLSAVDAVLAGIVKSGSTITSLKISSCLSASAFLNVTQRYPELEALEFSETFGDDDPYDDDHSLVGTDRDALAMAIGVAMGRLPSLRRVALLFSSTHARVFGMLSALHTAPAIKTVEIGLPLEDEDGEVTLQAAFVCACTKTLETVIFRGEQTINERLVEVSPLFCIGPAPSFSPSIKVVEFRGCCVDYLDESLAKRAAKSMEYVESLSFFMSPGSFARQIVGKMPRLKKFSFVSREDSVNFWEDGDEYVAENGEYSLLDTNNELAAFCRIINRKRSPLEDLEIELQGSEDEAFPAMTSLLQSRKGSLTLKLACLPWESCAHIVEGVEHLRPGLRELRLRFRFCDFPDQAYADILNSLQSNRTLRRFECDVVNEAENLTIFAIRDLVEANATLESLSFRELDVESCAALLEEIVPVLRWTNRTLRFLGLHGTDLADIWPRHSGPVLEMLKDNRVLSGVEGIDLAEDDPVALVLKQNRYGRRFLHANDSSPIGIWAPVLANVSQNKEYGVMYKFLRAKPDLVVRTARPVTARGRRSRKRGRAAR